jgi:Protein of unknown function (DUF3145)
MSDGLVLIHCAPSALLTHVEWTISGISGNPIKLNWVADESKPTTFRSSVSIGCSSEEAATLASAFMNLKQLSFEVIHQQTHGGSRWSFTPALGMFSCSTDEAGNLVVNENQLRYSMERAGSNALKLQAEVRRLLGQAWDDELENYRELIGGAESNYGVVTAEAERVSYGQNIRPL